VESRGGAAAEAVSTAARVSAVMQMGASLWLEQREDPHAGGWQRTAANTYRSDGCKGEGLQAACDTTSVARLQERMHAGCQGAIRGRTWAMAISASAVGAAAGGCELLGLRCV
jgi:hypothetical protein